MQKQRLRLFNIFSFVFLFTFYCLSCSKSNGSPEGSFTWTFRDTIYTAKSDTAYLSGYASSPTLFASLTPTGIPMSFTLAFWAKTFTAGTYKFGVDGCRLYYIDNLGYPMDGGGGTLNITSYNSSRMSGNFSATVIGASNTPYTLTGNFSNIPVKP